MTTALDWAVKHGNLEMAEMVAKAGVDVNAKSYQIKHCGEHLLALLHYRAEASTVFHRAAVHSKKLIIHSLISTYILSEMGRSLAVIQFENKSSFHLMVKNVRHTQELQRPVWGKQLEFSVLGNVYSIPSEISSFVKVSFKYSSW
ncbi:hypothetical protein AV530_015290 [Patagioenas fasciata monilis]|uniref:Uncharacterized protein n=1 Tax=Patagioenas fasciata monilis TaxID=372326 RepID=A0A1V4K396_PATFA|nr:hypothetical protein AV530_015290 [Patagioenas fasciata monilis]